MNTTSQNDVLFYGLKSGCQLAPLPAAQTEWTVELFVPRLRTLLSEQLTSKFAIACWAMDRLRIFPNRDCRVLAIRRDGQLVHSCWGHPAFIRYPFMSSNDMQVAKVWTHTNFRGKGLARFGVHTLLYQLQAPNRTLWYVVARDNISSIRVAEAIGLQMLGTGCVKRSSFGRFGDQYVINEINNQIQLHRAA